MVSTHLKNISQIGSFPQIGMKIKNIWNHHQVSVDEHEMTKVNFNQQRMAILEKTMLSQGFNMLFLQSIWDVYELFPQDRSDWKVARSVSQFFIVGTQLSWVWGTGNLKFILLKLIRNTVVEKQTAWTHTPCRSFSPQDIAVPNKTLATQ